MTLAYTLLYNLWSKCSKSFLFFSLEIHFIVLEWIKILTMLRGHKSLRVKLSVFLLFSICYFHNFRALNVFVIIFCQKCISFSSQQFIFKTFGVSFKIWSKTSHYKDLNTKLPFLGAVAPLGLAMSVRWHFWKMSSRLQYKDLRL